MMRPTAQTTPLAVGLCVVLTGGCTVDPPPVGGGGNPPQGQGRYASIGVCTPPVACSTSPCEQNPVIGPPDQQVVDVGGQGCTALDALFVGGTVIARHDVPDVIIHLGRIDSGVIARVEGSANGTNFQVVGFINGVPPGTDALCQASIEGSRALLDLSVADAPGATGLGGCNHVPNLMQLRISRQTPVGDGTGTTATGVLEIDAVEAAEDSYCPAQQQCSGAATASMATGIITSSLATTGMTAAGATAPATRETADAPAATRW